MNRRKDEQHTRASTIFAVILAFTIMAAGGVLHAYYKNRQVQISRDIDSIERHIEQARLEIRTTDMRMDQLLNRFTIRKQLEGNQSRLRPIPLSVIEELDPNPPARRSVASAIP